MIVKRSFQIVPKREPEAEVSTEESILVAFASSDMNQVNEHFGTASRFFIYRISATRTALESVCEFDRAKRDGNEDKLGPRLEALSGCNSIHCIAVGASAVRLLIKRGIYPIQHEESQTIKALLNTIQNRLTEGLHSNSKTELEWRGQKRGRTSYKQVLLEDEWIE